MNIIDKQNIECQWDSAFLTLIKLQQCSDLLFTNQEQCTTIGTAGYYYQARAVLCIKGYLTEQSSPQPIRSVSPLSSLER